MALNINGGTDHAWWTIAQVQPAIGTVAFWMRSTQATVNTAPLSYWSATSRQGWAFLGNSSAAGKMRFIGYDTTTLQIDLSSTSNVHDGNPHHICARYGRGSGNSCQLLIDGVQEANANASAAWGSASASWFLQAGDQIDAFWPTFIGDIWDIGFWDLNPVLSDDEVKALAKGYPPKLVRPRSLIFNAPLVRPTRDIKGNVLNALVGTTIVPHGRVLGGAV